MSSQATPVRQRAAHAPLDVRTVDVGGQMLRVGVRPGTGTGPALLVFNGIGANIELLAPFVDALDGVEVVLFDVPGVGGSPAPKLPYRLWQIARLADRLMAQLDYTGPHDVLGVSWGGALAQQYAFQNPSRCRRLVLAATSTGSVSVPGRLSVLSKMLNPRRYTDVDYLRKVGPQLYGGVFREQPELLDSHESHMLSQRGRGYYYQLMAAMGWSSLPWLPMLRQRTLVLAGRDDPIVPLVNARVMARAIPHAQLEVVNDGHLFVVSSAKSVAPLVRTFLANATD